MLVPLEGYRSHRFKKVTPSPRFKNVAAVAASGLPHTPLQERYRSHRFKNVNAVTASRMWPQSLLHGCYRSRRFKNVNTAVTASRTLQHPTLQAYFRGPLFNQKIYRCHLLRMLLQSPRSLSLHCYCCRRCKNVTASAASILQESYPCHRFKNATEVAATRTCLLRFS